MAAKRPRKFETVSEDREANYDSDEEGGIRIDDDIYIPPPPRARKAQSSNQSRLIISKIVNENFKSYAGNMEIGPFHVCFSAIVGPNGSGKSNLIDSMLFVFGYRATKIRSNKLSSLIHSSMEHPNCASCKVSVHFHKILDQDDGEYKEIPSSEVIVSRTAFKDSSSFYELNGRRVQFKEIAKFLRNEGVDLDYNRFLILQGEVEQIALMKPKAQHDNDTGMLEFLEDIIGTSRYKVPLEKLFEKIEDLNERVSEKTNRLKIAERDREGLKEPMQEAVDYLKHENVITKLEHKLYHCKKLERLTELKEKEAVHKELENDCNELIEEMSKLKGQKEELQQELKEKCKKWDYIQQQRDGVSSEFNKLTKKDENLHAELVETNKRRKVHTVTIQEERSKLEELAKVPEKNALDIEECEKLIEKHIAHKKKEDEALEELMGTLKEKTEPLMKNRAKLEKELIDFRKHVNEAKAAFDLAQSELEIYTSVEEKEKAKLDKLKETLRNAAETLRDRKEQLENFKKKIPRTEKSLAETKTELAQLKSEELEASTKLRNMRRQFEEQRAAMNASKSRSKVLDSLMQQKREGKLPGVIGRLGDLGAVDSKYDIAVSTACGGLDSIVVDTVDTAQACIEFLRQYNVGRAQFIPLEKQQHLIEAYKKKIKTPENVIRLFDLIKVNDERILPAFYYGLKNTLLADNLEQGSRIAYGAERWRVVTLQGQLIETSGTMSGGGQPLKGRIGQKVVRNEPTTRDVEKLQGDLDEVYERCNRLKARQPQIEEQIQALSTGLQEMLLNRDKFEIEVTTIQEQAPSLKQQLKAQEKKVVESKSNPERVQELTKAVQTAEKAFKKTEENSQSTEIAVQEINDKIEEVTGNRVKEQQKKISNLGKAIEKARKEIVRLQVGIKTSERDTQKTRQRIEQLEGDIETCKARIIEIKSEQAELEEVAKGLQAQLKEFDETLKVRDEASAALKEQITKIQARENKMKATKIDLDLKAQTSAKELNDVSQKISQYERSIQRLKLNDLPGEPPIELPEYTEEQIYNFDALTIANNLAATKENLPKEIPNMQAIKEYQQKDAVFLQRSEEVAEVTGERNKMRRSYDSARQRRAEEFRAGFDVITTRLKEMYQMITLGGAAELEPVDSLDPFTEGITFSVRPPKKSWKNISNLSGGEKTLSSLALVFALHHYKPTPLYFMDEIDAALDFKNVSIVGRYIKDRTKNAQFIVISLRSEMFELADQLVGIYKTFNATKNVVVDMKQFWKTHPELAEREQARYMEKHSNVGRDAFSQPARSSAGEAGVSVGETRMTLTCPPLGEVDEKDTQPAGESQTAGGILNVSMSSPPHSPKNRKQSQSLGGDTPITTRRSTRNIN